MECQPALTLWRVEPRTDICFEDCQLPDFKDKPTATIAGGGFFIFYNSQVPSSRNENVMSLANTSVSTPPSLASRKWLKPTVCHCPCYQTGSFCRCHRCCYRSRW